MASYLYYVLLLIFLPDEEFTRLVKGDPDMIEKIYEEYQKGITTYFMVKTFGNRAIAEDLVHETFCSIMESVHRLKTSEKLTFWVFTIAKRTLVNYQRKFFRQKKYLEIIKNHHQEPADMIDSIQKKQKLLLFNIAVNTLKPVYRHIFDLRYEKCNSVKEIAAITEKTEKSVENMLRRIKSKLKESMLTIGNTFFENQGGNADG